MTFAIFFGYKIYYKGKVIFILIGSNHVARVWEPRQLSLGKIMCKPTCPYPFMVYTLRKCSLFIPL